MNVKSKVMAALGSIKDQAAIGRASIAGRSILSSIEIAVLRSTDSSDTLPDDKYMREILFLISNSPGSITFLARKISTRLESARDPVVALKTLLLLHRLLRGGDRYFEQDLRNLWASSDLHIDLRWMNSSDPDPLLAFVLNYSRFLEERMEWLINQAGKLEPIRPLSGEDKGNESVLYRMSKCQALLDRIMDCFPVCNTRTSHVMQSAMNVVLKESFRVYESFCEGSEIVFSSFFGLKKHTSVLALDILVKACVQTSSLYEFYESCNKCVVGKRLDYPLVRIIASDEVSSMAQFEPKESAMASCNKCVVGKRLDYPSVRTIASDEIPSMAQFEPKESAMARSKGEEIVIKGQETSTNPFSQGLETKISTVWVEFDDDEESSLSSSFSFDDLISTEGESSKKMWKAMEVL